MGILISIISLTIASLFGAFKGIDVQHPEREYLERIFWAIIILGFIPLAIEFARDEYRALKSWIKKNMTR